MDQKKIKQRINKLWKTGKKDFSKIMKDTSVLVKKGEAQIKEVSRDAEKNLEVIVLSLRREKLYYELGKTLSNVSQGNWASSKKAIDLFIKVKDINRKIKSAGRK
ncbi:MAG: hypothetical protein KKH29_06250 [Candidatus Omnitrophica bacterium]|nr:hypothetical protein [Candidatus Omnitrophota bacterium]MBU4346902.1 hypothetical protein [Candidatus Omnitrophota bacterium]